MENVNINDVHRRENEEKLREAAASGDLDAIKSLVRKGVDINSQNIINHWTALHWACKRGHKSIVAYLLKEGANPSITTLNRETCWQLCSDPNFSVPFTGKPEFCNISSDNNNNSFEQSFVPHYLAHPIFPYAKQNSTDQHDDYSIDEFQNDYGKRSKMSNLSMEREFCNASSLPSSELVLRVKLENESDFIEVDFQDRNTLTFKQLFEILCNEFKIEKSSMKKLRKLPNTIVRNDRDVRRLSDFQELELVLVPAETIPFVENTPR
ncbi:hypothetical protein HELRODRAFT_115846 [Helobdella robusta]|uniref:Uncharacterized protein n=1 Tax=Helobdella robusta TaxID=6412 RepID=T1EGB3_HELRO|nr:hypothetical protein HELRODRAFT_115846 [Helobdella robusta]ESN92495.1 hypothetical protein HELRODRAFT_115846 [Helobdella robusta]